MKKWIIGILVLLAAYLIYHHRSVSYGIGQAIGQIKVLNAAVPLDEYLEDNDIPNSLLRKIRLIRSVKQYAEDSLGLKETSSYNSIYDQKGKAILWMLTASPEFELTPYRWSFPIAGKFEYKGFFDHEKAREEADELKSRGYDIDIGEVSAWSTLGIFSDPILTSMLEKDSARLADLIIHELCHASIYLKDSVELNENLASFIGKKGAERFLLSIGDTLSIKRMEEKKDRRNKWGKIIHKGALKLDSLYKSFDPNMDVQTKRNLKNKMIDAIRIEIASSIYEEDSIKVQEQFDRFQPNNAFFTGYLTYRSKSYYFEDELTEKFNGNLVDFIEYYRQEYGK